MLKMSYGLRAVTVILCFLSMICTVKGAEKEKDAFSFEYTFELNETRACHITVVETITFNEHYIGNPDFLAEFEGDQVDAGGGAFFSANEGPGSGGQKTQSGGGKYPLIEYLHYQELIQYNPHNFKATDYKTSKRLNVTERLSGDYKDFIIEIKNYVGLPEKGDTYTLIIEYDTENRVELLGRGRYAFSFYRKGSGEGGKYEYQVTVELPPYYEYERTMVSSLSSPSRVVQSGPQTMVCYQGKYTEDEAFEFKLEYHYPVSIFVEEGIVKVINNRKLEP
jgi:hypothetical protein